MPSTRTSSFVAFCYLLHLCLWSSTSHTSWALEDTTTPTSSNKHLRGDRQRQLVSDMIAGQYEQLTRSEAIGDDDETTVLRVQATDFIVPESVVLDTDNDLLSYLKTGDVLQFRITVPTTGIYQMSARINNPESGPGRFWTRAASDRQILAPPSDVSDKSIRRRWATFTVAERLEFTQGEHELELVVQDSGWSLQYVSFVLVSAQNDANAPTDNNNNLGFILKASEYDTASGIVLDPVNENIENVQDGASLVYSIDAPVTGAYTIKVNVVSPEGQGSFVLKNRDTHQVYGITDPLLQATRGWTDVTFSNVQLEQGTIPLELQVLARGFQIMYLTIALEDAPSDSSSSSAAIQTLLLTAANADATNRRGVATPSSRGCTNCVAKGIDTDDYLDFHVEIDDNDYEYEIHFELMVSTTRRMGTGVSLVNLDTMEVYGRLEPIPASHDLYDWQMVPVGQGALPATGTLRLRVMSLGYGWNFLGLFVRATHKKDE